MKQMKTSLANYKFLAVICMMMEVLFTTGCTRTNSAEINNSQTGPNSTMIVLGIDQSSSVSAMDKQDTSFVREICNAVSVTGGIVVIYGIGDQSDKSGIRCYLDNLPVSGESLTLSQRVKLARIRSLQLKHNSERIAIFLQECQNSIFSKGQRSNNTDIVGFFKKVDILCNEPENRQMKQFLFVYTDGVNSINGVDTPASYNFKSLADFTVCLVGWKGNISINAHKIKQFESPQGFVRFIKPTLVAISNI